MPPTQPLTDRGQVPLHPEKPPELLQTRKTLTWYHCRCWLNRLPQDTGNAKDGGQLLSSSSHPHCLTLGLAGTQRIFDKQMWRWWIHEWTKTDYCTASHSPHCKKAGNWPASLHGLYLSRALEGQQNSVASGYRVHSSSLICEMCCGTTSVSILWVLGLHPLCASKTGKLSRQWSVSG